MLASLLSIAGPLLSLRVPKWLVITMALLGLTSFSYYRGHSAATREYAAELAEARAETQARQITLLTRESSAAIQDEALIRNWTDEILITLDPSNPCLVGDDLAQRLLELKP